MKKIIISLSLLFSAVAGYSQQDAQFSQNMFNKLAINPGYAGSSNAICATLLGRQQWAGFGDGAPKTFLLSVDAPVKALRGGVGLNVVQDKIGFFNTSIVNLGYAYRLPLGNGVLGIGANVGFISHAIKGSWRAIDDYTQDASIPNQNISEMVLDASFGLYYNIGEQLYVGLSSTRLPASTASSAGGAAPTNYSLNFDFSRHYYIMAGYSQPITTELDLKPSFLVKTDAASTQLDLNCNIMYNKMAWAGLSYRVQDAIAVLLGFQHSSGLKIGYAYDFTTSGMKRAGEIKSDGSARSINTHEIMLGYCFLIPNNPKVSKHRNVRFL
ncbi:MAG: type IX secretion system membrane protein PorP/SprF [Bacteroidota bacterium]|nr:type IX secretion system membrane protein PorP/SprF [Bacteroidota bacterium]